MHTPVKTPDPSHEALRAASKGEPPARFEEPGPRRSDEREDADFQPKYLALPQRRARGHGRRNLAWGVALLGLSALLFAWALYLAGPGAAYTVAGALVTAAALYVIARSRLLRQRNGSFLAGAIVCLLGVFLVLVQQAWMAAVRTAIAVPVDPARPSASAPASPSTVPALWDEVRPSAAELESGATAKIVHEFKIEIDGKPYRLRAGDVFPVAGTGTGEVRLAAGAQEVAVPSSAVVVTEPKVAHAPRRAPATEPASGDEPFKVSPADSPAVITKKAQAEATRRYPALGVKDSPENKSFVEAYQELKYAGGGSFFEDPEWPLRLAEMLAAREGWGSDHKPASPTSGARPPLPSAEPAADPSPEPDAPRASRAPSAAMAPSLDDAADSEPAGEPRRR